MKKTILVLITLSAFSSLNAEIIMPKVFSDNMVLQRQVPVKIWGKADANASVKVEFANQSKEAKACENGNWSLYLEPMEANANNQNMQISENGKASVEIKDILVGEVWIAGGQSNMVRSLKASNQLDKIGKRADNSMLRMFYQEVPLMKGFDPILSQEDLTPNFDSPQGSKWLEATSKNTGGFGAVAFFFAERLIDELNVPVAVIQTPVGGSNMITWLAKEDLKGIKTFEDGQLSFDAAIANAMAKIKEGDNANSKDNAKLKEKTKASKKSKAGSKGLGYYRKLPSFLYNTKIAPIAGYTAKGFIWYQGEADAGNPEFADMFVRIVNSWRKYWGTYLELDDGKLEEENMPFYAIQLVSYDPKDVNWAETRWAQYLASKKLDDVELAINIDTGLENDIHPTDKDIVGTRLGNLALAETYDLKKFDDYNFPMLDEVEYKNNVVEVEFDTDTNLKLVGDFRGFEVLIGDTWAEPILVELKKDTIILKSRDDSKIGGVRYLWKNWAKPDVSLYNELDLPAMSFIDLN